MITIIIIDSLLFKFLVLFLRKKINSSQRYFLAKSVATLGQCVNFIVIKPTFSYMISAHGVEYRNYNHRDQDVSQAWNRLLTLWFFAPGYTLTPISMFNLR